MVHSRVELDHVRTKAVKIGKCLFRIKIRIFCCIKIELAVRTRELDFYFFRFPKSEFSTMNFMNSLGMSGVQSFAISF
jgi:hypothetical protein